MKYDTVSQIAREIGTTRQNLAKMLQRHENAPKPNEEGKYDLEAVRKFYNYRTYVSEGVKDLKNSILEQEYRLKKAKADEAEDRVISTEIVKEILDEGEKVFERVLRDFINGIITDKEQRESAFKECRMQFKRWDNFRASLK